MKKNAIAPFVLAIATGLPFQSSAFNGQAVESSFFGGTGTTYGQTTVEYDRSHSMEPIGVVKMEWNELRMAFSWGTLLRIEALNGSVPYWKVAEASYETPDWRKGELKPHELPLAFDMYVTNWEWRKLGPYDGVPIVTGMDVALAESDQFPNGTVFTLRFFRMAYPYLASDDKRNKREFRMCEGTVHWASCPFVFPEAPEPPEGFDPKTAYLGKRPSKPAAKGAAWQSVPKPAETSAKTSPKLPKLPPNPAPWLPRLTADEERKISAQVLAAYARHTAWMSKENRAAFAEKVARQALAVASRTSVPKKKRAAFAYVATLMEREMSGK